MAVRFEAELLIPGEGAPIPNGTLVVEGPTIRYAGPTEGAPEAAPGERTHTVPVLMPGLWDCHCHLMGLRTSNPDELARTPVATQVARAAFDAQKALRAGFTSVREVGGHGLLIARAIDEGTIPGPHVYGSGMMLSPTGGHGDFHSYPLPFVQSLAEANGFSGVCDGVPDCLRAVRRCLRLGARVIKICATGGVLSDLDHPEHAQFSPEELRAIAEEAARAERIVAAHCHGKAGILAALAAGIRTIEHGSFLDGEAVDRLLEAQAMLVPTRFVVHQLVTVGKGTGLTDAMFAKATAIADRHRESLRLAVRRGVPIAAGSDIFASTPQTGIAWGMHGGELVRLVEDGGMSPLQAIQAGTANGPRTLGPQAPRSGQLREGFAADFLVVRRDPVRDITVLADPENVQQVWKDGRPAVERPA